MKTTQITETQLCEEFESAPLPLWREAFWGLDWLALRRSPVFYGMGVPRGDGAPVILIPGFLASDNSLHEMLQWLRRIGYQSYMSGIGRNADCPNVLCERLFQTMDRAYGETGQPVRLVGYSLGGIIARVAAIRRPAQVAQVITLGTPFAPPLRTHPVILALAAAIRASILKREAAKREPQCHSEACRCPFARSLQGNVMPASVHRVTIYTKSDGVVDWRSCLETDETANVRVASTHLGLIVNPQAYRAIALSLAAINERQAILENSRGEELRAAA